jgi:hypothetical protein
MESPDELKAHQRMERDKVGSWKVESLDELQEELIKGGKGTSLLVESPGKLGERFWDSLPKCH